MTAGIAVQLERHDKKQARAAALHALERAGRSPIYPVDFRSQFGEDALVWTLLDGQLDGFFIEAGAFDGYHYSVTYALECVGWTGLLIEAIPERVEECRERRRRSQVVHAVLGAAVGGETAFTVTDDEYGGMFSHTHATAASQRKRPGESARTVPVPVTTLDALLAEHGGGIDVAVIDVEGAEMSVLHGFDLRRHRPKVILIEDNSRGRDATIADYMRAMPYVQLAWLKINRVYVRTDLAAECVERLTRAIASAPATAARPPGAG
jgi:FkbM family methyltransferase